MRRAVASALHDPAARMRVAAQEGVGGASLDGVATRSGSAATGIAGGGFFALLALAQGAASTAQVDAGTGTAQAVDDVDAAGEGDEQGDASTQDESGVVVSLSVAAMGPAVIAGGASSSGGAQAAGDATGDGQPAPAPGAPATGAAATAASASEAGTTGGAEAGAAVLDERGAADTPAGAAAAGIALARDADDARQTTEPGLVTPRGLPARDRARSGVAPGDGATSSLGGPGGAAMHAAPGGMRRDLGEGDAPGSATGEPARADTAARTPHAADTRPTPAPAPTARQASARGDAAAAAATRVAVDDGASEANDEDAFDDAGTPRVDGSGGAANTSRAASPAARLLAEPLPLLATRGHAPPDGDGATRPDALGLVRPIEAVAGGGADGTSRLRAAGFGDGTAGLPSWVDRLASPDGLAATRRGHALHLDLEPNGLGRIEVRLSFGRDGVRASLITEHEHTRALLASQHPQLAAALERNDLRLESFLVDVGAQGGGEGRQDARDAADAAAFDELGLVHVSEQEVALETPAMPSLAARGLVNVRA